MPVPARQPVLSGARLTLWRLLGDVPQSGRALARQAGIHRESARDALAKLRLAGYSQKTPAGWVKGGRSEHATESRPGYVVLLWVSPQLRERYPEMISMMEAMS